MAAMRVFALAVLVFFALGWLEDLLDWRRW